MHRVTSFCQWLRYKFSSFYLEWKLQCLVSFETTAELPLTRNYESILTYTYLIDLQNYKWGHTFPHTTLVTCSCARRKRSENGGWGGQKKLALTSIDKQLIIGSVIWVNNRLQVVSVQIRQHTQESRSFTECCSLLLHLNVLVTPTCLGETPRYVGTAE